MRLSVRVFLLLSHVGAHGDNPKDLLKTTQLFLSLCVCVCLCVCHQTRARPIPLGSEEARHPAGETIIFEDTLYVWACVCVCVCVCANVWVWMWVDAVCLFEAWGLKRAAYMRACTETLRVLCMGVYFQRRVVWREEGGRGVFT